MIPAIIPETNEINNNVHLVIAVMRPEKDIKYQLDRNDISKSKPLALQGDSSYPAKEESTLFGQHFSDIVEKTLSSSLTIEIIEIYLQAREKTHKLL